MSEEAGSGEFEICPVCFWEDDPVQFDSPAMEFGANGVSLDQARANFKKIGACEKRFLKNVRKPLPEEKP